MDDKKIQSLLPILILLIILNNNEIMISQTHGSISNEAEDIVVSIYNDIIKLEKKNVEVNSLISRINDVFTIMTEMDYHIGLGDIEKSDRLKKNIITMLNEIKSDAENKYDLYDARDNNLFVILFTDAIIIIITFILGFSIEKLYLKKIGVMGLEIKK